MFNPKNANYGQPNNTAIEHTRQFRDFVVVGRDKDGNTSLWATGDQRATEALLREAAPAILEPAE
jgi:hypothetical protein